MPRTLTITSCTMFIALGMLVAIPQASAQVDRRALDRDAALPAIGPNQLRVVPPTPRVRITDDGADDPSVPTSRRRTRSRNLPEDLIFDSNDRESTQSEARRASRGSTLSPSSSSPSSSSPSRTSSSDRTTHSPTTYRRAVGESPGDDPGSVDFGRLIVMTQSEGVRVTIDGQPYPNNSMEGVLLYANEQYDVLLEEVSDSASRSSSSTTPGRVITVRVGPGETRVLLANLGSGTTSSPPPRSRTDRRSRTRDTGGDDEEEIGYLGVSSSPRGTVYVDDENTGQTTPARRIQLPPGRHEVRIFYESEERFSETKNVLIREGVNTNVFFRLRRDELEEEED